MLAGPDPENDAEPTHFQPKVSIPLQIKERIPDTKIGIDRDWIDSTIRSENIRKLFYEKIDFLQKRGAEIISIKLHDLDYYHAAHMNLFLQELLARAREYMDNERHMARVCPHWLALCGETRDI